MMAPTRGLLLLAHGARDPAWAAPFHQVAQAVRDARPGLAVELAFLELMAPDLAEAGRTLAVDRGCTAIDVVPLFLGGGGHVRRDVPALVDALRAAHPSCAVRLHAAAGEAARVIAALAAAAIDFVDSSPTATS
jgi:sirohydrochlorin cobaltochelatase